MGEFAIFTPVLQFSTTPIPLQATGQFSKLTLDYLAGVPEVLALAAHAPTQAGLAAAVQARMAYQAAHPYPAGYSPAQLVETSHALAGATMHPAQADNLDRLRKGALTITTGHQLALFGGPQYVLYKALSAVKLAQQCRVWFGEADFVPIFWLASEDHDFEEVHATTLLGQVLEAHHPEGGQGPVGRLKTDDTDWPMEALMHLLGSTDQGQDLQRILTDAYAETTWGRVTLHLLSALLGKHGILFVDADNSSAKHAAAAVLNAELEGKLEGVVAPALAQLTAMGYKVQAPPRPINLFYLTELGQRERIVRQANGTLSTVNDTPLPADVLPEHLSPNVVMRPLYQEAILPNIAYIGGPAEVAYWLELQPAFAAWQLPMPVVLLRNTLALLDSGALRKADKLGLSTVHLFEDEHLLQRRVLAGLVPEGATSLAPYLQSVQHAFEEMAEQAALLDATLAPAVLAEAQKVAKTITQLEGRLTKAAKLKNETSLKQATDARNRLLPNGALAERTESWLAGYLRYGPTFTDMLLEVMEAIVTDFLVVIG